MKKLFEKIDFLIFLVQQIYKLLQRDKDPSIELVSPQQNLLSAQQLADRCLVQTRQVRRWVQDKKIEPTKYIGASPYFAADYIEEAFVTGRLRIKKRR
ncbi:hypothetical protein OQY15_04565 [Pedobacter sp. MC2016-15]|uniref:hypothetical protein n=1 Tax=Pedobacter sp. MC2016-15 TaxID=2994473 RepID=UPI002247E6D9|nr:hypothetical protein [Pedobacter sp. MC2016-15]MCX2478350.1 hypothetical protein [Pedobacter sp. MC2016-15]